MKIDRRTLLGGLGSSLALPVVMAPGTAEARRVLTLVTSVQLGANMTASASNPSVTTLSDGTLMAGWISQTNSTTYAYVCFYDSNGVPITGNIKLHGGLTDGSNAESIQVVATANGRALALFTALTKTAIGVNYTDVYLQKFGSDHAASGARIQVNTTLPYADNTVRAVRLTNGNVLVMWNTGGTSSDNITIVGRVVSPNGAMLTSEKVLTNKTPGVRALSCLAAIDGSKAVFTYLTFTDVTQSVRFYAQTLDANADQVGAPLLLKTAPNILAGFGSIGVSYLPGLGVVYTWYKRAPRASPEPKSVAQDVTVVWRNGSDIHEMTPVFPFDSDDVLAFPSVTSTPNGDLLFTLPTCGTTMNIQALLGSQTGAVLAGPQMIRKNAELSQPARPLDPNNLDGNYLLAYSGSDPNTFQPTAYFERWQVQEL